VDSIGCSALHWAAIVGNAPAVKALLKAGANPFLRDQRVRPAFPPRNVCRARWPTHHASVLPGLNRAQNETPKDAAASKEAGKRLVPILDKAMSKSSELSPVRWHRRRRSACRSRTDA